METIHMDGSPWRRKMVAYMQGSSVASIWDQIGLLPFWLASQLYGGVLAGRDASYRYGLRHRRRLPCRVVSIGNVTLGGTGKTPLTLWTALWFQRQGWRVAVLSRGYGGRSTAPCLVVSEGHRPLAPWRVVGDEPYLLAQRLRGIPVLTARDRYQGGLDACEAFGAQVVILDDGFQHVALHRDLDVVLIDASNPFGHGALVPRGVLREPLRALQRASAIVLTRADMVPVETLPALCRQLRQWHIEQPIYAMATVAESLSQVEHDAPQGVAQLARQRVVAFAGVGNPQSFVSTLSQLGSQVVAQVRFPDHHAYTDKDWRVIVDAARRQHAACLVTTEKDAVRLKPDWQAPVPVYALRIGVRFVGVSAAFEEHLQTLTPPF